MEEVSETLRLLQEGTIKVGGTTFSVHANLPLHQLAELAGLLSFHGGALTHC